MLIEGSINSLRISVAIKKSDEVEVILAKRFMRFLTQRSESFVILRRKPVPVCILVIYVFVYLFIVIFFFIFLHLFSHCAPTIIVSFYHLPLGFSLYYHIFSVTFPVHHIARFGFRLNSLIVTVLFRSLFVSITNHWFLGIWHQLFGYQYTHRVHVQAQIGWFYYSIHGGDW